MTKWHVEQIAKWQGDKMTKWQNDKLTKWQVDKMTSWQNGKLTKWHSGIKSIFDLPQLPSMIFTISYLPKKENSGKEIFWVFARPITKNILPITCTVEQL